MPLKRELKHAFVGAIPEPLEEGVLYISIEFATVAHRCACGCGREVIIPLSPAGWSLKFDGRTVSLWPSIGNWSFPCRSHYIIERDRVWGAMPFSDAEVAAGRRLDARCRENYFSQQGEPDVEPDSELDGLAEGHRFE